MRTGPYETDDSRLSMTLRLLTEECNDLRENCEKIRHTSTYPDNDSKLKLAEYQQAFDLRMQKVQEAIDKVKAEARDIDDPSKQNLKIDSHGNEATYSMAQEGITSGGYYSTPNMSVGSVNSSGKVRVEETLSREFGPGGHTYIILATQQNAAILHHIYARLLNRKLDLIEEHAAANPEALLISRPVQRHEDRKFLRVPALRTPPRLDSWIVPKGQPFNRVTPQRHLVYLARFDLA